jgi:2,3-dihydroxy-p-cumate/2,3-dihydroxybenzoate 3,4-dioxygenase
MSVDFRYRRLGYIALGVTDIERSIEFATEVFGLDVVGADDDGRRFLRGNAAHHDVILQRMDEPTFVRSSWELETEEDLDRAFAHYEALRLEPKWISTDEAAALSLTRAFRLLEPTTRSCFEYFSQMTQISSPRRNRLTEFQGGTHFGFVVENCRKTIAYMTENMGFLVSDFMENGRAALLRAFPNPNHHSFAPLQFGENQLGFQHIAFMVKSIDDIGRLFNRIKQHGVKIQFGIGRHPTSGSIHLYIYDPDYIIWEYTYGMEQFPEQGARAARRMSSRPEDMDLWGAVPDAEYFGRYARILQTL